MKLCGVLDGMTMSVAPDGKEGLFTALTSAPLFLAMLPTGAISGGLLQRYCPGEGAGACDGRFYFSLVCHRR